MVMLVVVVAGRSTKLAQIRAEQQQKAAVSPIWRGASRGQLTQSRHVCIVTRVNSDTCAVIRVHIDT